MNEEDSKSKKRETAGMMLMHMLSNQTMIAFLWVIVLAMAIAEAFILLWILEATAFINKHEIILTGAQNLTIPFAR